MRCRLTRQASSADSMHGVSSIRPAARLFSLVAARTLVLKALSHTREHIMARYYVLGLAALAAGPAVLASGVKLGLGISLSGPLPLPSNGTPLGPPPHSSECPTNCVTQAAKNVGCPDITATACYCQNPTFFKKAETCFSLTCTAEQSQAALSLLIQDCGLVPSLSLSDIIPIGTTTGGAGSVSSAITTVIIPGKSASTPAVSLPTTITTSQPPVLSSATSAVLSPTTTSDDAPRHVSPPSSSGTAQSLSDADVTTTVTSDANAQTGNVLNPSTNGVGARAEGLFSVVIALAGAVLGALLL
ncbi:hypothetical protein C8Q79DRAFT_1119671 [Trametes meyenii]|nr:hypothetical protein C8Q79DRAFT_1119671 [Trametes meyenii]